MSKIAAIQMCSTNDVDENLINAAKLITDAAKNQAALVVLPEMFAIMAKQPKDQLAVKEKFGKGKIQDFLAKLAYKNNIWIVAGTIPIESDKSDKVRAASLVYDNCGKVVARYDKIHLFDAALSAGESYQESLVIEPGNQFAVVDTPVGKLGLAVCYDIRFPAMFTHLFNLGAEVLAIPAAFTAKTGEAHWQILMRSRAVENFCYVVGACQGGVHSNGRQTYGHALIVEPWGSIISEMMQIGSGTICADINLEHLYKIRRKIPVASHQKIKPDVSGLLNGFSS